MTANPSIDILIQKARQIRQCVFETAISNGGHIASSFSCTEILVSLYYDGALNHRPDNPGWQPRDRFVLSKGHAETGLYVVLSDLGYFPKQWLNGCYRRNDCRLGGHPDISIPGVEITSGALGHGLGIGAGITLAAMLDGRKHIQYVLLGDAECTEGAVWETALFAAKQDLNQLVAIVDRNHIGSIDFTANYTQLEPFEHKWRAFGWQTVTCNGHDFVSLREAFMFAKRRSDKRPLAIIAETVKGKGIDFMENDPIWHVKTPESEHEISNARAQLKCNSHDLR